MPPIPNGLALPSNNSDVLRNSVPSSGVHNSHSPGKSEKRYSLKPTRFSPICITRLLLPGNYRKLFQSFITALSKSSKRMCLFTLFLNRSQILRSNISRSNGSLETSINSVIVLICVMPLGDQCCVDCMSENEASLYT